MHDGAFDIGARARCLLWGACALLLGACFAATKPIDSTQTGNPPAIKTDRLALKVTSDAVHIVGEPGAVSPSSATVHVTNLTNGNVSESMVAPDGSFDVRVRGSQDDAYVVDARADGKSSSAVYVVRGGAAVGERGGLSCMQRADLAASLLRRVVDNADRSCMADNDCRVVTPDAGCALACNSAFVSADGQREIESAAMTIQKDLCAMSGGEENCSFPQGVCIAGPRAICAAGRCAAAPATMGPTCDERSQTAAMQLVAAYDMADKSCMVDSDCVVAHHDAICYDNCGFEPAVSQLGRSEVTDAVAKINAGACRDFKADGCNVVLPPCMPGQGTVPSCQMNQCVLVSPDTMTNPNTPPNNCTSCLGHTLTWGYIDGLVAYQEISTVEPCAHYMRVRRPSGDPMAKSLSCEEDLTGCNVLNSTGAIQSKLIDKDVQLALASTMNPVLFGADRRAVDAPLFQIQYGKQVIWLGESCDGMLPNCIPVPAGLQALKKQLLTVDELEAMVMPCSVFKP